MRIRDNIIIDYRGIEEMQLNKVLKEVDDRFAGFIAIAALLLYARTPATFRAGMHGDGTRYGRNGNGIRF